jgi:ArsR family transcriptional regulator
LVVSIGGGVGCRSVDGVASWRSGCTAALTAGAVASSSTPALSREAVVSRPVYQVKAEFFKTLGHPARIRVLELLRDGERTVGELLGEVGLEQSHLSQQLAVLRRANVIRSHKDGARVLYAVVDPRIFHLLETAKAIISASLAESDDLLAELALVDFRPSTGFRV